MATLNFGRQRDSMIVMALEGRVVGGGFLFIWLGFAVVTALAAASRNRSALGWFGIGVLFGVFALIAVLVMKPGEDAVAGSYSGEARSGDFRRFGHPEDPLDGGLDLGVYHGYQIIEKPDGVYADGVRHVSASAARTYILHKIGKA